MSVKKPKPRSRHIVVLGDGETWQELDDGCMVVKVSPEQWEELMRGTYPKHMHFPGVNQIPVDWLLREARVLR